HRVRGLGLIAPHFIVEDVTAAAAEAAKVAYESADLRPKLARWHQQVDVAFHGWNGNWTDPAFKQGWDISDNLAWIRVPIRILQGENDAYGTARQIAIAEAECYCPVEATLLPGLGHSIFKEAPAATASTLATFARDVLG